MTSPDRSPLENRFVAGFVSRASASPGIAPNGLFSHLLLLAQSLDKGGRDKRNRVPSPESGGNRLFTQGSDPEKSARWISCRGVALLLSVLISLAFWTFVATLMLV